MLNYHKAYSVTRGFSLVEVIIFITLIVLVFVTATSYVINSLYRMRLTEHKTKALYHAEELKEWLEGEHDADWIGFSSKAGSTYCVNQSLNLEDSLSVLSNTGNCPFNGVSGTSPAIFSRTVRLTANTPTQVTAHISVSWNESAANGTLVPFVQSLDAIFTSY